ncbi:rop guanine nucleotide exchange factor 7-like [Iris pallida]|uniref:Rop guanine nucleotide exchange factor 7-like n=1 Tax=Iris pallida TaxID=29817 RepID=A0AAX6HK43_IRIPA|nr:rop guanine nucleotide exchange factor 7-like [Iris pallida]
MHQPNPKGCNGTNRNVLAKMEVPQSYIESLTKNGRASLGDSMHQYVTSDQFSPEYLLDCHEFSSEHQALEIANHVEASIYVWQRRTSSKPTSNIGILMEYCYVKSIHFIS